MKTRQIIKFLFFFIFIPLGFCANLPKPIVVKSEFSTFDDEVEKIYINTFDKETSLGESAEISSNLNETEFEYIRKFIKLGSDSEQGEKELIISRYGIEEEQAVELLKEAKDRKFKKVHFIFDINRAIIINEKKWTEELVETYQGRNKEMKTRVQPYINDIEEAFKKGYVKWNDSPMAKMIQELEKLGFKLNKNSKFGIYSPGVYFKDANTITPIMHLKETFMIFNKKIRYMEGTFNWSKKDRFNKLVRYVLQEYFEEISETSINRPSYSLSHAKKIIEIFSRNEPYKSIKDKFSFRRVRFLYKDGSFQEPMYNLGNLNQNDRLVTLLDADDIKKLELSHFVSTNSKVFKKILNRLLESKNFIVDGILDTKFFGWLRSYGIFQSLFGFDTVRPEWTPDVHVNLGDISKIEKKLKFQIFSKISEGAMHDEIDGYPKVEMLWHDKTHYLEYTGLRADFFYGSMNLSNNLKNTDLQTWVSVPDKTKSKFFQTLQKIAVHAKKSMQKHLLKPHQAVIKNSMCYFLGLGYDKVDNEFIRGIESIKTTSELISSLRKLAKVDRGHVIGLEKSSPELVELRISILENLLQNFVKSENKKAKSMKFFLSYFMTAMSHPKLNIYEIQTLISVGVARSFDGLNPEQQTLRAQGIYEKIKPALKLQKKYFEELNSSLKTSRYVVGYDMNKIDRLYDGIFEEISKKMIITGCDAKLVKKD